MLFLLGIVALVAAGILVHYRALGFGASCERCGSQLTIIEVMRSPDHSRPERMHTTTTRRCWSCGHEQMLEHVRP